MDCEGERVRFAVGVGVDGGVVGGSDGYQHCIEAPRVDVFSPTSLHQPETKVDRVMP